MRTRAALLYFAYLITDLAAILAALLLSALYSISPHVIAGTRYTLASLNLTYIYILLGSVWYFSSKPTDLYEDLVAKSYSVETFNVLKNILFQCVFLVLILFSMKERILTRTFVLSYTLILTLVVLTEKLVLRFIIAGLKNRIHGLGNVLIIGANDVGSSVYRKLVQPPLAYRVVGFVDNEPSELQDGIRTYNLAHLELIIRDNSVTMVFVALLGNEPQKLEQIIRVCRDNLVEVKIIPDWASYHFKARNYSFLGDMPVVSVDADRLLETHWRLAKRAADVGLTLFLMITIFSWLFPLVMVLQKLFNPGRIFYSSERWGRGGRPFRIFKFRTMNIREDQHSVDPSSSLTERNDYRVTRFGRILRRTSVDEMPQFLNVLRGEMSIVGPRPLEVEEAARMKQVLSKYMVRHYVLPGITGWAEINGCRGGTRDTALMQKRIDLDNWYIDNWTLGLDFQIILMTAYKITLGDSDAY